jgi:hypothetical protein
MTAIARTFGRFWLSALPLVVLFAVAPTVANAQTRITIYATANLGSALFPFEVYVGPRHHYYNYYGGWRTGNGCRPGWTVQGGVCKPYRYGPWDIYGGRQSDYGF